MKCMVCLYQIDIYGFMLIDLFVMFSIPFAKPSALPTA